MYLTANTKNLFDYKNPNSTTKSITSHGVTLTLKNDCLELKGKQNDDVYFECSLTGFNIPFEAGKTYILSLDKAIPHLQILYFNGYYNGDTTKQLNLIRVQGFTNKPLQTFTPTQNGYFSQIVLYSSKAYRFSGTYFIRVQIEEGSTATPYVPCGYLQMYRMKYKVSNVCQLYNKSVARLPWVESGITVSVDGNSVVFNGTATSNVWVYFSMVPTSIIGGHKYYFGDLPYIEGNDNRFSFYLAYTSGESIVWLTNNELKKIFVPLKSGNVYFISRVLKGMICNNFKITPQLFDLTEMYGAGNEPTTVEEFRKDFPDEYYEYSPNTYLTTHSRKLITSANTSISFN